MYSYEKVHPFLQKGVCQAANQIMCELNLTLVASVELHTMGIGSKHEAEISDSWRHNLQAIQ